MDASASSCPSTPIGRELPPEDVPAEPSDLDIDHPPIVADDTDWEVFIPDDDQCDPLPEPGDFWIQQSEKPGA